MEEKYILKILTLIKEVRLDEDAALDSTELVVTEFIFCIKDC